MNRNNSGHRPGAGGNHHKKRNPGSAGWAAHYATKKKQKKDHRHDHDQLDSSAAVAINAGFLRPTLANRKLVKEKKGEVNTTTFLGSDAKLIFDDLLASHAKHREAIPLAAAPNNKSVRNNSNSNSNSNSNNSNSNKCTAPNSMVMNARRMFWKRKLSTLSSKDFVEIWNEARNKFLWNNYHNDLDIDVDVADADADAIHKGGSGAHGHKKNQFTGSTDRIVTGISDIVPSSFSKSGGNANTNANTNANGHGSRAAGKGQTSITPQAPSALRSSITSKSVVVSQVADKKDKDNNFVIDLCDSSDEDDNKKSKNAADSSVANANSSFEYADILAMVLNNQNSTTKQEPESEPTTRANSDPPATTARTTAAAAAAAAATNISTTYVAKATTAKQPQSLTNRWSKLFLGPDFRSEDVFSLDEGDEII